LDKDSHSKFKEDLDKETDEFKKTIESSQSASILVSVKLRLGLSTSATDNAI